MIAADLEVFGPEQEVVVAATWADIFRNPGSSEPVAGQANSDSDHTPGQLEQPVMPR